MITAGCLSGKVYRLGLTPMRIEPNKVLVASDGSVALDTFLIKKKGYFRRYVYSRDDSVKERVVNREGYSRIKNVMPLVVDESKALSVQLIPPNLKNVDATQEMLPIQFSSGTAESAAPNLKIAFANPKYERALWSYPCQILLIPTLIIDTVVYPYWVLYRGW